VGRLPLAPVGGEPLPPAVAESAQRSFGQDFSAVRVHSGGEAARMAAAVGARAFTVGRDIFLGARERASDHALIAHELVHVVQQRGATTLLQRFTARDGDGLEREAQAASAAAARGERVSVSGRTSPRVQRLGISDALDYFADKANLIPGFRMFTIVLGVNPVNMSRVERSAANIMRAIVEFIPGGGLVTRALDAYGIFDRVGAWVEQQIRTLGMVGGAIREAIDRFLASLSWTDIFDLGGVWQRAKRIFSEPIDRIISFAGGLITGILGLIKDAILRPLAGLAQGTRGWDLLKAVLGQDPITGDPVPRTAETLIGGFMKLIGQEEVWENIKRANAIPRAWAWFQGALSGLIGLVTSLPSRFLDALRDLTLEDVVLLAGAFAKVGRVFATFIGDFFSWAGQQVMSLLQIIFEVVAPGVMPYIRKAMGAFSTIIRNPIGFVGNLVRAGVQGFRQFAGGFLGHLRKSLIDWVTGTLSGAGVYIPQSLDLREIVKFVLSVLGITWQNIRGKLVRVIGDTAMNALETGFDLVMTLVREGPAAAWQKILEAVGNLRDMVMGQVMEFVKGQIVQIAMTRLAGLLTPAGAFIQAILAIYSAVMTIVERLRQIGQVVAAYVDSISAIAAGAVGAAANRVEQTMAGLLTLLISFLARFIGLGKVSDVVLGFVRRVQARIDQALDRVVAWIVAQVRRLGSAIVGRARAAAGHLADWWRARKSFGATDGSSHALYFTGERAGAVLTVSSGTPTPVNDFLRAIRAAAMASTTSSVQSAYHAAVAKARVIDGLRATVERADASGRQAADIDRLNSEMEGLVPLLAPLIPLAFPPPAVGPGAAPVAVGEMIKLTSSNLVAKVTGIVGASVPGQLMVNFRVISPRQNRSRAPLATGFLAAAFGREFAKYTDDPRELFMGPTPGKGSNTGKLVITRMTAEGKMAGNKVLYSRDGKWYDLSACDMGHVIDAVTWWNTNGRLTGARSPTVRAFMENAINYELEPSGPNQARGAALAARGIRYLPPEV
jgi:hypothetical protein